MVTNPRHREQQQVIVVIDQPALVLISSDGYVLNESDASQPGPLGDRRGLGDEGVAVTEAGARVRRRRGWGGGPPVGRPLRV